MKYLFILIVMTSSACFSQRQEATITRTFGTNSVFPRQFPSSTIRKMNDNEYWIYDSLGTNTIFHRIFPTYIIRKQNTYTTSQQWGVYRTTSTNSVFPRQFPDRYISDLNWQSESENKNIYDVKQKANFTYSKNLNTSSSSTEDTINSSYTYNRSLRSDGKSSYSAESPE